MAKVIRKDQSVAKIRTCHKCGSVIEYYPIEVVSKIEDEPYGGGSDSYHYLTCPGCNSTLRWSGSL